MQCLRLEIPSHLKLIVEMLLHLGQIALGRNKDMFTPSCKEHIQWNSNRPQKLAEVTRTGH